MKTTNAFRRILRQLSWALLLLLPAALLAQDDNTISPSLDLVSVQKADQSIDLKATIKAKVKGNFIKLPLLKVSFVQVTDTTEVTEGFVITDRNGQAVFNVKPGAIVTAKDGTVHFKALFAGNKKMDAADAEVTVKRAYLQITPVKEDSVLTVKTKLIIPGKEADSSLKELTIGIFVKRSFNPLKIGEGTTDEAGEVGVEIPNNLPGDTRGKLTLLARLDENETFGNLEAAVVQPWGTPLVIKDESSQRALWTSHPPLWMLFTFIILMSVVWGHYIVIVVQLIRLRKEEPATV